MDTIVDLLRAIKSRYKLAIQLGQLSVGKEYEGRQCYCFNYPHDELSKWFDDTRNEVINIFSDICKKFKIPCLKFPRKHSKWF
ncbi:hypothetical protein [Clostridium ganghwense]|uniref:Uncharacterized protein n=1 Tax=Clostridium ganghwense TaxID=312089 RepID=A0ABT4CRS3_9CLOT|nr:hypothetical protein [Clostridium ganghwense]MCY6371764.1 hypothetical protein [Clostridium ganghwense]